MTYWYCGGAPSRWPHFGVFAGIALVLLVCTWLLELIYILGFCLYFTTYQHPSLISASSSSLIQLSFLNINWFFFYLYTFILYLVLVLRVFLFLLLLLLILVYYIVLLAILLALALSCWSLGIRSCRVSFFWLESAPLHYVISIKEIYFENNNLIIIYKQINVSL